MDWTRKVKPVTISYDTVSTGGAAVILQDTNTPISSLVPLKGRYSIFLEGEEFSGVSASIVQTGQIPLAAQSLTFWAGLSGLELSINGQPISYTQIGTGANYTIYGADVSQFSGQTVALGFLTPANGYALLDNIQFSSTAVPEPSTFALAALGGLAFSLVKILQRRVVLA